MKTNRINQKYGESKSSLQNKISDLDIKIRTIENNSTINLHRPFQKKTFIQNGIETKAETTPITLTMEDVENIIENRGKAAVNKAAMAVLNENIANVTMLNFNKKFVFKEKQPTLERVDDVFLMSKTITLTPSQIFSRIKSDELRLSDKVVEMYLRLSKITGQLSALNKYLQKDSILYDAVFKQFDNDINVINDTTLVIKDSYFSKEEREELKKLYEQMFDRKTEIQKQYNNAYSEFISYLQDKQEEVNLENKKRTIDFENRLKEYTLRYSNALAKFKEEEKDFEIEKDILLSIAKKAKIKTDLA